MKVSRRGTSNAERKCKMAHEKCATCKRSSKADGWVVCANCIHNNSRKDRYEPMTNADRIREMTDDELANFVATYLQCEDCWLVDNCVNCGDMTCFDNNILSWLRSPVEEVKDNG